MSSASSSRPGSNPFPPPTPSGPQKLLMRPLLARHASVAQYVLRLRMLLRMVQPRAAQMTRSRHLRTHCPIHHALAFAKGGGGREPRLHRLAEEVARLRFSLLLTGPARELSRLPGGWLHAPG